MKTSRLASPANPSEALHLRVPTSARSVFGSSLLSCIFRRLTGLLGHGLLACLATASAVNLKWDPNPETDIASYRVNYGTSAGTRPNSVNAGLNIRTSVTGLQEGSTYYFTVTAINTTGLESEPSDEISYQVPVTTGNPVTAIPRTGWALQYVDSQETANYAAANAFDGDPTTFWHTAFLSGTTPPPHEIRIDLGSVRPVSGFRYLPRQDPHLTGNISQYEFYVSLDGTTWGSPVASGTFASSSSEKEVLFATQNARFVRLRSLSEVSAGNDCNVAELNVLQGGTVNPPANQAPVAVSTSATTNEDTWVSITLAASDNEGNPLTWSIVTPPAKGTLSGTAPVLKYTPNADTNGADSFTYKANDGTADSNTATVSITVNAVNDAPVAVSKSATTNEDTPVAITLAASDKEGNSLTWSIVTPPTKGKLSGTAPILTYTPNADINGADSFSYKANDGSANSTDATVSITVNAVNDAPVAVSKSATTNEDTPVSITLAASDKEGSPLTWSIVSGPTKGKLSGTAPNLTYTPNADTNGADSFTYKANDGSASSTDATVSITVTPKGNTQVNRPPVFKSNPVTLQSAVEGTSYTGVSIADAASDPDQGDSITFAKTAGPEWLEISSAGKLSGTPPAGSEGVNRFTVRATDTAGAYADSILLIEISAADLPLPWELERIGKITGKSRAAHKAGTFTLASSGNLAGKSDSGAFIWQTLTGDGEIIARVNGLDDAGKTSRAGLMIRDTLAANSRHVFIGVNGGGDFRWVRRTRTGGQTLMKPEGAGAVPKVWLRLVRKGETIIASKSANGSDWTRVGSTTVDFGKNCYIGLSISSGDATPSTATFRGVTVNP